MSDTFYKVKLYFSQHDDDWVEYVAHMRPTFWDGAITVPIGENSKMTYAAGTWHHVYILTDESPA